MRYKIDCDACITHPLGEYGRYDLYFCQTCREDNFNFYYYSGDCNKNIKKENHGVEKTMHWFSEEDFFEGSEAYEILLAFIFFLTNE